jgi:hypothetical protein
MNFNKYALVMFAIAGIMTIMFGAIGTSSAQDNQTSAGTTGTDNQTSAGANASGQTSANHTGFMDKLLKMFGMGGNK